MRYRIGSRGSKLALIQSNLVKERLETAYPESEFEIVVISTKGDRITGCPIAAIGDNALFTREIEQALLSGRIDMAVHSMKDLPSSCPHGLTLAKAWKREDPRDVLVLRNGISSLSELPMGATVATGSPRRTVLLRMIRPDLRIVDIRGNVDTRLRKLFDPLPEEPHLDGIVLAAAGLKRMGKEYLISEYFDPEVMIPAANQGALAIELRASEKELKLRLDALGDDVAELVARSERGFLQEIGADCHMPIGAIAEVGDGGVSMRCVFARNERMPPSVVTVQAANPDDAASMAAVAIRKKAAGVVTLVGAGPGDPGLITVRGLESIREADVVVYDRLVSDELLGHVKPGCELVYVGKESGLHTMPQNEINALLLSKAMHHDRVVRLKGGDPFVFGRGGEEMSYLSRHGVRCAVIPGITSAIAAPACVGIPVTYRGVASGFQVITAHARNNEPLDIDFANLLDERRTLVFLMGLARVREITGALVAAGRRPSTPSAVISSATTSAQRCVTGTLVDIADKVDKACLSSPAVLIVGDVISLRGSIGLPLTGRRILLPEIEGGKNRLCGMLTGLGAEVDVLKVGRIVASGGIPGDVLAECTWIAFTSRNGLVAFNRDMVDRIRARGVRIAAVGNSTAKALRELGMTVDLVSKTSTGNGLLTEISSVLNRSDVVLHPTAAGCRDSLAELASVCDYHPVIVYRNERIAIDGDVVLSDYDAVVFTCASSALRTLEVATGKTRMLAIGPTTAATLMEHGCENVTVASDASLESLVELTIELIG